MGLNEVWPHPLEAGAGMPLVEAQSPKSSSLQQTNKQTKNNRIPGLSEAQPRSLLVLYACRTRNEATMPSLPLALHWGQEGGSEVLKDCLVTDQGMQFLPYIITFYVSTPPGKQTKSSSQHHSPQACT